MVSRDDNEGSARSVEDLAGAAQEDAERMASDAWPGATCTHEDGSQSSESTSDDSTGEAELEELGEVTAVDAHPAHRLAQAPPPGSGQAPRPGSGQAPRPGSGQTDPGDSVVAPAAVDGDDAEPPPELAAAGRGLEDLGPAFPSVEDDLRLDPLSAPEQPAPAGAPEPAAAVPTHEVGGPASRPGPDDGWGSYDSGGWPRLTTGEADIVSEAAPARGVRASPNGPAPGSECLARLIGLAGTDCDGDLAINAREVTIGRVSSNDIILTDHSVSREHARVLQQGDTFVVIDLGSANGTFVNGQRVDRAAVRTGDEVRFGTKRFRFVAAGGELQPAGAERAPVPADAQGGAWAGLRASLPSRSVLISASMLTVAVVVAAIILIARRDDAEPQRQRMFRHYLQGVEAFKQRDWIGAETEFSIVLGLDPRDERARRYLEEISRERRFEGQLAAALAYRDQSELAQAYVQASAIVDSLYTPEAKSIMRGIEAELDARVARARTTLEAGRPDEALVLLDSVDEVRPGRPDVLALRDRAVAAQTQTGPSRSETYRTAK